MKADSHFSTFKLNKNIAERLKIEAMYSYPVSEQTSDIEDMKIDENLTIPIDINFDSKTLNLSSEEREKLSMVRPQTVIFMIIH